MTHEFKVFRCDGTLCWIAESNNSLEYGHGDTPEEALTNLLQKIGWLKP